MARSLDVILVVDLESTCWEGSPPPGQTSEIIEIGLRTVDLKTLTRTEKRSFLVKPVLSEISEFCTELTTLTPDMLTDAGSLADAVKVLKKEYGSKDRLWASWGDYDRRQFERVCKDLNVGYPFGPSHLNVKSLFAAAMGSGHELGLDGAYKQLGLELEGTHHRGDDDAWNIAQILCRLLKTMRSDDDE
ncbi:3'-5' exonuclease [Rubripirellula reticaptiva]|uniref:Sporulation inhibitor KapD n=1 Tax=Rubripirellula reticaptiva TaxID=2528013 RepID=A0A5C6ELE7_9BACT|nr:3'-5' exonuclease [Rubripirellula reticaptiva]TWU49274.1 sporulation inhibitor KapD [Rubripirellula reticaptiva]